MASNSPTDFPGLLRAAQNGDRAARERVLAAVLPRLQAYVRLNATGLVLSREWSLDVAQSICVDALGALKSFEGTSEPQFRSWMFQIALNKIRMRHRFLTAERRDARRDLCLESNSDDTDQLAKLYGTISTPSRNLSAKETVGQLEAAMEQLSEEQRLTLTMATVLGLTHREIAEQLGKAEPAVRKTLSRARARLSLLVAMDGEQSD